MQPLLSAPKIASAIVPNNDPRDEITEEDAIFDSTLVAPTETASAAPQSPRSPGRLRMKTDRLRVEPLLAQLSVKIPSEKPQNGEQRPPRDTLHTRVARETTDDN